MAIDMSKSSEQRMAYVKEIFESDYGMTMLVNRMKNYVLTSAMPSEEEFIRLCVDADLLTKAEAQSMIDELNESTNSEPKETDDSGQGEVPTPIINPSPNPNPSEVLES